MKRRVTFDTVGIFQAVKLGRAPLRAVLMRTFFPADDPYEQGLNPRVNARPYYDGHVRYSVSLFVGSKLRLQVEIGDRP